MALIFFALFQVNYCEGENMSLRLTDEDVVKRLEENNIRAIPISPYTGIKDKITFQCMDDPTHIWDETLSNIVNSDGCPICHKRRQKKPKSVEKSLWGTHPEVAALLENPEDGYTHTYGSKCKVPFICPHCGARKIAAITDIVHDGFSCRVCHSTSDSYPNRFMIAMLDELGIEYIPEYSPDWLGQMRYDFYFIINQKEYIIEMDGFFHFNDLYYRQDDHDEIKNRLAEEHGIKLIRINCNYDSIVSRFNYIKNNIIESELSDIFDLSLIDFHRVEIYADIPYVKIAANYWNDGIKTCRELQPLLPRKLNLHTVRTLIRHASELNLISESVDEINQIFKDEGYAVVAKKFSERQRKKFGGIVCNETGKWYPTLKEAAEDVGLSISAISLCVLGKRPFSGKLPDGTKLTWRRATETKKSA